MKKNTLLISSITVLVIATATVFYFVFRPQPVLENNIQNEEEVTSAATTTSIVSENEQEAAVYKSESEINMTAIINENATVSKDFNTIFDENEL